MKWSTSAQLYKSRTSVKSNDHRLADMARLTLAFLTQLPSEGQQVATAIMVTRSTQPRKCTANTQLNHEPEQPATMLAVDDLACWGPAWSLARRFPPMSCCLCALNQRARMRDFKPLLKNLLLTCVVSRRHVAISIAKPVAKGVATPGVPLLLHPNRPRSAFSCRHRDERCTAS